MSKTFHQIDAVAEKRAQDGKEIDVKSVELIVEDRFVTPLKEATTVTINGVRYNKE